MSKKNDMLGPIIRSMVGVPAQFLGTILDLCNKLAGADGKLWYEKIRTTLRESVARASPQKEFSSFLHLLPGLESIRLSACDGTYTLAQAQDVFSGYVDPEFTTLGLDMEGVATLATHVQVYEQLQNGTFRHLFGSLSSNLDQLVMTQHQVIKFCEEHYDWLKQNGDENIFLLKDKGELFVAYVRAQPGGLFVFVSRFEDGGVRLAEYPLRLVVPQLEVEDI